MFGLDPEIFFSSTVLVYWAIAFIPWFLFERKYFYFAISWLLLFAARLSITWDVNNWVGEVTDSLVNMVIMTATGVAMYLYMKWKKEQEENENTNKE